MSQPGGPVPLSQAVQGLANLHQTPTNANDYRVFAPGLTAARLQRIREKHPFMGYPHGNRPPPGWMPIGRAKWLLGPQGQIGLGSYAQWRAAQRRKRARKYKKRGGRKRRTTRKRKTTRRKRKTRRLRQVRRYPKGFIGPRQYGRGGFWGDVGNFFSNVWDDTKQAFSSPEGLLGLAAGGPLGALGGYLGDKLLKKAQSAARTVARPIGKALDWVDPGLSAHVQQALPSVARYVGRTAAERVLGPQFGDLGALAAPAMLGLGAYHNMRRRYGRGAYGEDGMLDAMALSNDGAVGTGNPTDQFMGQLANKLIADSAAGITSPIASGMPVFVNGSEGELTVSHREYVGEIVSNGTAFLNVFHARINPGLNKENGGAFPWLSQIARCFQQYRFDGLSFHFKSTSGSLAVPNALGVVLMAPAYNTRTGVPASKEDMLYTAGVRQINPTSDGFCDIETSGRKLVHGGRYFVRSGPVGTHNTDQDDAGFVDQGSYDLCEFNVGVSGQAPSSDGVVLGSLWVTYQVSLWLPHLPNARNAPSEGTQGAAALWVQNKAQYGAQGPNGPGFYTFGNVFPDFFGITTGTQSIHVHAAGASIGNFGLYGNCPPGIRYQTIGFKTGVKNTFKVSVRCYLGTPQQPTTAAAVGMYFSMSSPFPASQVSAAPTLFNLLGSMTYDDTGSNAQFPRLRSLELASNLNPNSYQACYENQWYIDVDTTTAKTGLYVQFAIDAAIPGQYNNAGTHIPYNQMVGSYVVVVEPIPANIVSAISAASATS